MPDYYIAEDGTIHDREAEHRSRTQHTAAPAVADTTAEDTPEVSFARQFVYWLFALSASVFAAICVFHEMQAAFTPPAHLDFLEDYVQQFVFEHAKALVIILTVFCIYLYGKTGAKKHRYNVLAYLCTVSICCFAPPAAVFVLMAVPILIWRSRLPCSCSASSGSSKWRSAKFFEKEFSHECTVFRRFPHVKRHRRFAFRAA